MPASEVLPRRTDSYTSAYAAQLTAEEVRQLTQRSQALTSQINQARAEEQLIAIRKAEAERAAQERAAAEEKRQLELARQAEQQKKQQIAAQAANRFKGLLQHLTLNQPENIDEKLRWLKEKYQELHAANLESSEAQRDAGLLDLKGNERLSSLKKVKQDIDALVRVRHGIENVNISTVSGAEASARPLVVTPDGLIAGYEGSPFSLNRVFESLGNLRAAALGGPVNAFFSSVLYTPTLGNSELQRNPVVVTIPLSQLVDSDKYPDLQNSDTTDLLPLRVVASVRGDHTQLYLSPTDENSSSVRVRQAILDSNTNLYTFTTEGSLPRTLTWTPNSAPGGDTLGSTDLPVSSPDIKIYPGARVTQVEGRSDEHPMCDETDIDDYILVFPAKSGIKPVYVMASRSGPRYEPGTASGMGQAVGANWLGSAGEVGGSPIPVQIADQLRGQDFRDFDKFREKLWSTVTNDPELRRQFSPLNTTIMKDGYSPYAPRKEQVGGGEKFEIHHIHPIGMGGEVYNMDNMVIMTPKTHITLHSKDKGEPQ